MYAERVMDMPAIWVNDFSLEILREVKRMLRDKKIPANYSDAIMLMSTRWKDEIEEHGEIKLW